jgi:Zn-dependent M28 family amino/carboxypeptidase
MTDLRDTESRLREHIRQLTVVIGERSVAAPVNLDRAAAYLRAFYRELGIGVRLEPYEYQGREVANVVAEITPGPKAAGRFVLGAHYDSVAGTVGADDNASAVAVQLETARALKALSDRGQLGPAVACVSFALEEPPAYGTQYMGSRVYAAKARRTAELIDGMICLEMVGYTARGTGSQRYPFPLNFFGYPKEGNFIGIVGNFASRALGAGVLQAFSRNPGLPAIRLTVPFGGHILPAVRLSDHASFWDAGFKAVMITDGAFYRNPHYHRPSDTMETLDFRFMAELVEGLALFFSDSR